MSIVFLTLAMTALLLAVVLYIIVERDIEMHHWPFSKRSVLKRLSVSATIILAAVFMYCSQFEDGMQYLRPEHDVLTWYASISAGLSAALYMFRVEKGWMFGFGGISFGLVLAAFLVSCCV